MAFIPIKEYGERHGVAAPIMRQRCQRGAFKTARKIGSSWFVDEDEEFVDHRKTLKDGSGPARKIVDSRFPVSWSDEFSGYWPEVKLCSKCAGVIRPRWLDLKLEEWDLLGISYSEQRTTIQYVLRKIYCPRCARRQIEAFDKRHE